jgi:hypothetical protein
MIYEHFFSKLKTVIGCDIKIISINKAEVKKKETFVQEMFYNYDI